MFQHVRQRGPSDCGVAAVAMLTGRSYEEVYAVAVKADDGRAFHPKRGMGGTSDVLEGLGYHRENLHRHKDHPAPNPDGPQFRDLGLSWTNGVIHPKFYAKFLWGRQALLSIKSLHNLPNGRHLVYFDGTRIWDPQEGRKGKKFSTDIKEVEICEAYIVRHH